MATRNLPVMLIDDVVTDEDLRRWFEHNRKTASFFAFQYAMSAASLKAMLREHDRRSGKRARAARVSRPIGLAASVMVLIAKYLALSCRRFELEYQSEIASARGRRRAPRTIKFGD